MAGSCGTGFDVVAIHAFIVLPMMVALWVTRRVDRLLVSRGMSGHWWRIVSVWCIVSSLALFASCSYYTGRDATTSLNAGHMDGGFKVIAFFFWNALLILSANGVAAIIAGIRGRSHT